MCVNNKLWVLEFYPYKEEESLSEEMEIVPIDRAIALWRDENNDREHEEIRRLCSSFIDKHPQVLKALLFSSMCDSKSLLTQLDLLYNLQNDSSRPW